MKATRAASEDDLLTESRQHRDWMLRTGTTTAEAKSGYGLERETELRMLRVMARLNADGPMRIVPTLLAAHTFPPEFAGRRDDYIRWIAEELIPEVAEPQAWRAFATPSATTTPSRWKKPHGTHCCARSWTGASRARGAVSPWHGSRAGRRDARAHRGPSRNRHRGHALNSLRAAAVQPVLLPGSVFALARTAYPPARAMVEHGLAIVLASDFNPGSSPIPSMPFIVSLSCLTMGLTPAEALTAATINAAWSLGLGDSIGSWKPASRPIFLSTSSPISARSPISSPPQSYLAYSSQAGT